VAQTLAILEVVHSAVGLVRAPVVTTAAQVASRLWLVWGVLHLVPSVASSTLTLPKLLPAGGALRAQAAALPVQPVWSLYTLLAAWGASELVRYGFFAAQELGLSLYPLLWLRYTAFYVLYPLGVSSELALAYLALPTIKAKKLLSILMPNRFNFAFDYYLAALCIMAIYAPGFYTLYGYMIAQRKKKLAPAPAAAEGAGKKKRA
jgi:very-long-chain (3R)-3-hydroxyacyl-CoA dehydratase